MGVLGVLAECTEGTCTRTPSINLVRGKYTPAYLENHMQMEAK